MKLPPVHIRLEQKDRAKIEKVRVALSCKCGVSVTRSHAIRVLLAKGYGLLEKELKL